MYAYTYYDPLDFDYSVVMPLPSVSSFSLCVVLLHGMSQLVSLIAQHKTNIINSLMRAVRGLFP